MKVFITYKKNGLGGQIVDKVYLDKNTAIDNVIHFKFKDNKFYKEKCLKTLIRLAEEQIFEYETIGQGGKI